MTRNLKIILVSAATAALGLAVVFLGLRRAATAEAEHFGWDTVAALVFQKGYPPAMAALDARLAKHPNDAILYYFKARLYYDQDMPAETLAAADKAIQLGYLQQISQTLKAMTYGRLYGDYARQKELASKALALDPLYEDGYLARAEAEYALKDYKACAADSAAYSGMLPSYEEGYERSMLCLLELKDYKGAEAAGLKVLSIKPDSDQALWQLGRIYYRTGLHKRAINKFSEAIRLSGGREAYYFDRAHACEAAGDLTCAAWDYASTMDWKSVSDYATNYYQLGVAMYRAGELKQGLGAADQAVKKAPLDAVNYELRGRLRADSGDLAGAKKDFLKMASLSPSRSADSGLLIKKLKEKEYTQGN